MGGGGTTLVDPSKPVKLQTLVCVWVHVNGMVIFWTLVFVWTGSKSALLRSNFDTDGLLPKSLDIGTGWRDRELKQKKTGTIFLNNTLENKNH